ncbi:MAG: hydroxymethylbilane synthase [Cyclobacteriaceae bacterium]|nr:hydroxymethylbilane synthase [Cyclobacteriaceae bacterium]
MCKTIRIGTRSSQLALWQANKVKALLEENGFATELVKVDGHGDQDLSKPLHQLGTVGLFTKNLDDAMLEGKIDIAVHSLKDVPTDLHPNITQAAVLERGEHHDVIVLKEEVAFLEDRNSIATIATGSLRRKAQWLARYKNHSIAPLRGNVNTRLSKLQSNNWLGAIFAKAGLERIDLLPKNHKVLDWMIPSPAQGAIMITALKEDEESLKACFLLNHKTTEICVEVERAFMKTLEGGCTAPIGAKATIKGDLIHFEGGIYSLDESTNVLIEEETSIDNYKTFGQSLANKVLGNGGKELMAKILKSIENE